MKLISVQSLRCPSCGAHYKPGDQRCQVCGTVLSAPAPDMVATPVSDKREELIDYYAMIGWYEPEPPSQQQIDQGFTDEKMKVAMNPVLSIAQRQHWLESLEIGHWILRDTINRSVYDALLTALRHGTFTPGHLQRLRELQQRARRELGYSVPDEPGIDPTERRSETAGPSSWTLADQSASNAMELLQQGVGYQVLGMHKEAAEVLRQAVAALPDSPEAHYRYALALLETQQGLFKSPHILRQALSGFQAAARIDPNLLNVRAYVALIEGLLAREMGDQTRAYQALQAAIRLDNTLGMAWQMLAMLELQGQNYPAVLHCCHQALRCSGDHEQSYLLLAAACWKMKKQDWAYDAAQRAAKLRGGGCTPEQVLQEIRERI